MFEINKLLLLIENLYFMTQSKIVIAILRRILDVE